jgi:glycosyltransferase involved in cell wall biosynthesis
MSDYPKIAIVYDRVNTPYGGAEKLLLAIHELFPQAPLYTSVYNPQKAQWADVFKVRSSFLNKIPFVKNHHQLIAFLMPLAFESFDFSGFDLVISITSAEAKGIVAKPETKHLNYLLTPPRYLYSHRQEYLEKSFIASLPIINFVSNKLLDYLTRWDQIAIHRPDKIIPISHLVKKRAKEYYNITTSQPIYPAIVDYSENDNKTNKEVDTKPNKIKKEKPYLLMVTRLVPYKKINLAIQACQELDQKLVIVGAGKEKSIFKNMIYKPDLIDLAGNVKEDKLADLYQNCLAVLMPGEEDFGIVALEALSHQKPVIINANSGAAELIEDKKTGLLLKSADLQDIKSRILEVNKYDFKPAIMDRCLSQNNAETFKNQFKKAVNNALKED